MEKNISVYSDLKIFHHTDQIRDILDGRRTTPIYIRIKPTNVCNQRCYYCGSKDDNIPEERQFDKTNTIPWDKMQEVLKDIEEMKVKALTFSGGGEPLVYPYILPSLEYVKKKQIDYSMITNGQALEGQAADLLADAKWIRISLESARKETYEKIRGVKTFDKVISNIENFSKVKNKTCTVGINCVVTKDNYQEIYELCILASKIGVDNIKFSPLRINGSMKEYHKKIQPIVNEQIKRSEMELKNTEFCVIDKYDNDISLDGEYVKPYHRCMIQEVFTVIGADCKVYLCHQRAYTKDGDIGSLNDMSFKDLWYSDETINKVRNLDVCKACDFRCVFDERNILLNQMVDLDRNHVNFI